MMGCQDHSQDKLFYSFNLEDHVPQNHLLRGIDRYLDLSNLRQHLANFYSHTGRPSIDPELMIRMLIIGYCFGIRSERRLCEEVHLNLAYRWFCRLGLEDPVPNHSSFSKNRHGRFRESGVFRHLFETVLQRCISEGLVGGEGFATDASIIKADAQRMQSVPGEEAANWVRSEDATRAMREYLDALEDANPPSFTQKHVSTTDPSATWTAAPSGPAFFAYSTNYLIDLQSGIVVDVEASSVNKATEVEATKAMLERVEEKYDMKPERLVGDTSYGSAKMLSWLVDKEIEPHVPVLEKSARNDGTYSNSDFQWVAQADEYRCPEGKALRNGLRPFKNPRSRITKADTVNYRANQSDCGTCPSKSRCCPNTSHRKIARSIHEDARNVARQISTTPEYRQSRRERKKVEILFAHLKRILRLDKLRLRSGSGAQA